MPIEIITFETQYHSPGSIEIQEKIPNGYKVLSISVTPTKCSTYGDIIAYKCYILCEKTEKRN